MGNLIGDLEIFETPLTNAVMKLMTFWSLVMDAWASLKPILKMSTGSLINYMHITINSRI